MEKCLSNQLRNDKQSNNYHKAKLSLNPEIPFNVPIKRFNGKVKEIVLSLLWETLYNLL